MSKTFSMRVGTEIQLEFEIPEHVTASDERISGIVRGLFDEWVNKNSAIFVNVVKAELNKKPKTHNAVLYQPAIIITDIPKENPEVNKGICRMVYHYMEGISVDNAKLLKAKTDVMLRDFYKERERIRQEQEEIKQQMLKQENAIVNASVKPGISFTDLIGSIKTRG